MKNEQNTLRALYTRKRLEEIHLKTLFEDHSIDNLEEQTSILKSRYVKNKFDEIQVKLSEQTSAVEQDFQQLKTLATRYKKLKLNEIHEKIYLNEVDKFVNKTSIDAENITMLSKGMGVLEKILESQGFFANCPSVQTAFQAANTNLLEFSNKKIDLLGRNARKLADVGNFIDVMTSALKLTIPQLIKTIERALGKDKFKALQDSLNTDAGKEDIKKKLKANTKELILRVLEHRLHEEAPGTPPTGGGSTGPTGTGASTDPESKKPTTPDADKLTLNQKETTSLKNAYNLFRQALQRQSTGALDWLFGRNRFGGGIKNSQIITDHDAFATEMFFHALSKNYVSKAAASASAAARLGALLGDGKRGGGSNSRRKRRTRDNDIDDIITDIENKQLGKEDIADIIKAIKASQGEEKK